jgi:hypothetical protein
MAGRDLARPPRWRPSTWVRQAGRPASRELTGGTWRAVRDRRPQPGDRAQLRVAQRGLDGRRDGCLDRRFGPGAWWREVFAEAFGEQLGAAGRELGQREGLAGGQGTVGDPGLLSFAPACR